MNAQPQATREARAARSPQAQCPCPQRIDLAALGCACAGCDLAGCKVAVIGGLDRMEPKYRKAVEELGGKCLFHPGRVQGGCQRLRQLVAKADLVVFMTSTNSHGALGVIKDHCKRCDKPFCAVANNGVSSLERTLRGFAA
jgi:hypothetical protein